jgi:phage FluMu protein Com
MNKLLDKFLDLKCPVCGSVLELKGKEELLLIASSSSNHYAYFEKLNLEDKVPVCLDHKLRGKQKSITWFWTPLSISSVEEAQHYYTSGWVLARGGPNGIERLNKLKEYYNNEQKITQ